MRSRNVCRPLVLLSLLALASPAPGQSNRNAATWYQRAMEAYGRLEPGDIDVIRSFLEQPGQAPGWDVQQIIARAQPLIDAARRGSMQQFSDFSLDHSLGMALTLPHLQVMRDTARIMNADALVRLQTGDAAGAADQIGAMYRFAEHMVDDRTMISSLVSRAMFNLADGAAQFGLDHQAFDAAMSADLLRATQRYDGNDPFGVVESLFIERDIFTKSIGERYIDDRELMLAELGWGDDESQLADDLRAMDRDTFIEQLDQVDVLMTDVIAAFEHPDPEQGRAMLDDIEIRLEAGEFGQLALVMVPAFGRVFDLMHETRQQLHDRQAMLRQLAEGAAEPGQFANAALLYVQAIELMKATWEAADFEMLRRTEAEQSIPPDDVEVIAKTVETVRMAIDLMRQGSELKRCDFSLVPRGEAELRPQFAPGLSDAMRLVLVDAALARQRGETATAIDRLAIIYRMAAHIGEDASIVMSLIAHHAFDRALRQSAGLFHAVRPDEESLRHLHAAVDRMARHDPFGYVSSIAQTRESIAGLWAAAAADRAQDRRWRERLEINAGGWSGEHLLALSVLFDALRQVRRAHDHAALGHVLDIDAIDQLIDMVPYLAPGILRDDARVFTGAPPRIAPVSDRLRSARRSLLQALELLGSTEPEAGGVE